MYQVLVVVRDGTDEGMPVFNAFHGGDSGGRCSFSSVKKAEQVKLEYEKHFLDRGKQRGEFFIFVEKGIEVTA